MIIGRKNLDNQLEKMSRVDFRRGIEESIRHVRAAAIKNCEDFKWPSGELEGSIDTDIEEDGDVIRGICSTEKEYAALVEFGTGPRGQASHEGVAPDVAYAYGQSPWWIHESLLKDPRAAEEYQWFYIDTPDGRFYQCSGQPAHPFMYPALKDNEELILKIMANEIREQL